MRLKDFIVTVLTDIDQGIEEAQQKIGKRHALYTFPPGSDPARGDEGVQFDVAVTASAEISGKIDAEVNVVSLFSGGAKTEGKLANGEVSRIKFRILPNYKKGL
jgi:hypothetical protein